MTEVLLHRVRGDEVYDVVVRSLIAARRIIAWFLEDNFGEPFDEGYEAGQALPLTVHGYTWSLVTR